MTEARRPWREAAILVVLTRLVFYGMAYAATHMFAGGQGPVTEGFLDIWNRWDTRHFMTVADLGWVDPDVLAARPAAFFPLYPLAIRALSSIGITPLLAGLLISALATWVACAYLIKLADEEIGRGAGHRAALYLLLFPTAVFLVAPYSEALFLAGAIPAFYYARRGRWLAAALPAAVASATRAAGIFLLAGLVFEYVRQAIRDRKWLGRQLRNACVTIAAGAAPIVAFAAYLWATRGTAMQYFIDQRDGWGRNFPTNPVTAFQATWNTRLGTDYPTNWIFAWRIEILAALAGILLTLWAAVRKEWGYAAYMGLFMVSLLMSSWYFSIPRMLLSFFPAMLFFAHATQHQDRRHELALLGLAPVATLGVILFTRAAWFF